MRQASWWPAWSSCGWASAVWKAYLCKTLTGEVLSEVDIPSFSWSLSINSAEMSTTREFSLGEGEGSGVELPWIAVSSTSRQAAAELLATGKRAIALGWEQEGEWKPIVWGAIGDRTDTLEGTSFDLESIWDLLDVRFCVSKGDATAGSSADGILFQGYGTDLYDISFKGVSRRAACAGFGAAVSDGLEDIGGSLPIDWQYEDESGGYAIKSEADYLSSQSFTQLVESTMETVDIEDETDLLASFTEIPPEVTFVPYYSSGYVRLKFVAGSDDDPLVSPGSSVYISEFNDMQVQHAQPYECVLALGEGNSDDGYQKGWGLSAALCLASKADDDPYPLREMYENYGSEDYSELVDDSETYPALKAYYHAMFVESVPLCQVSLEVSAYDLPLGEVWPGDTARVLVEGFPSLPDGEYDMRIATMQGNQTDRVMITFECMEDPMYG